MGKKSTPKAPAAPDYAAAATAQGNANIDAARTGAELTNNDNLATIPNLESLYLITHDVDLALTHADRILLLRDGQVVADGPPATVIADEEAWIACNLRLTSLLRANARFGSAQGRLLDAEALANEIVAAERAPA